MLNVAKGVADAVQMLAICFVLAYAALWFLVPRSRTILLWVGGFAMLMVALTGLWMLQLRLRDERSAQARNEDPDVESKYLDAPAEVKGLNVTMYTMRKSTGLFTNATLAGDQIVDGWPAAGGSVVEFDESGTLHRWESSREVEVWGRKWPAKTVFLGDSKSGKQLLVILHSGDSETLNR